MKYFELPFRLQSRDGWMIYFQNDRDGVVLDKDGTILFFDDREGMTDYARRKRIKLRETVETLDLDQLTGWTQHLGRLDIDCPLLYRTWNLLGDIATSLGKAGEFLGYDAEYESLHEELFWGCNLPGPSNCDTEYKPRLTDEELECLQEVFAQGLEIVRSGLRVCVS